MAFSRRAALQLALGLWARAETQVHQHSPEAGPAPAALQFLSPREVSILQQYAAILIPPGPRSGGAPAAAVEVYIDRVLAEAAPSLQRTWRRGLERFGRARNPEAMLARTAIHEFRPRSRDEHFFVLLKSAVTTAFYTSEEGILRELGYQGMSFLREFPGYQGEALTVPEAYRPLLRSRS